MRMRTFALGALTSVLISTGVGAPVVSAPVADAQVVAGNDKGLNIENFIPQLNQLNLTVKKVPANPNDQIPAGQLPPGGVEKIPFTLYRVQDLDVTTTAGREAAKTMTVADAQAKGWDAVTMQVTNANGETRFTGLNPGLYLLKESVPDSEHDYRTSDPQLILLPLADSPNGSFETDSLIVTKAGMDARTRALIRGLAIVAIVLPAVAAAATLPAILSHLAGAGGTGLPGAPDAPGAPGNSDGSGHPGTANAPGAPDQPGEGSPAADGSDGTANKAGDSTGNEGFDPLAVTGADVLWYILAGSVLILFGTVLARRNKKGARNA